MAVDACEREGCPEGYTHVCGSCTAYVQPHDSRSIIEVGECPRGQTKAEGTGICYYDCHDGYYRTANGSCFRGADTVERDTYCRSGYSDNGAGCTIVSKPGVQEQRSKIGFATCADDREEIDGLCYLKCISPYYRSATGTCQRDLQSHERDSYCAPGYSDNGAGCTAVSKPGVQDVASAAEVGSCASDRDRVDGICYKRCTDESWGGGPSFYRTIGGICHRDAMTTPRDTRDRGGGTGVYQSHVALGSYSREPRGAATYKVFAKERKVPIPPTTESDFENSTLGSRIHNGLVALENGDLAGLGQAAAGAAMVGNPMVVSLGAQDLVSLYAPGGTDQNSLV